MSAKHRDLARLVPHQDPQDRRQATHCLSLWKACVEKMDRTDQFFYVLTDHDVLPDVRQAVQGLPEPIDCFRIKSVERIADQWFDSPPLFAQGNCGFVNQSPVHIDPVIVTEIGSLILARETYYGLWQEAMAGLNDTLAALKEPAACSQCVVEPPLSDAEANGHPEGYHPAASKILPAWFIDRMTTDTWTFGLLLVTGSVLVIETINRVIQDAHGNTWIDVELQGDGMTKGTSQALGGNLAFPPCSRKTASINLANVVAAFELADT